MNIPGTTSFHKAFKWPPRKWRCGFSRMMFAGWLIAICGAMGCRESHDHVFWKAKILRILIDPEEKSIVQTVQVSSPSGVNFNARGYRNFQLVLVPREYHVDTPYAYFIQGLREKDDGFMADPDPEYRFVVGRRFFGTMVLKMENAVVYGHIYRREGDRRICEARRMELSEIDLSQIGEVDASWVFEGVPVPYGAGAQSTCNLLMEVQEKNIDWELSGSQWVVSTN